MLKDITLGQYFPGNTLAHRLDPRAKLMMVISYIVALFCAKSFLSYGILALALFYTGLFAGMFRLTSSRRLQTLTFGEFWKIGVYAGFPVMLVASCFPAFDLPYLSYSTVFMIGLVVYWLVAVARVERAGVSGSQEG